MADMTTSNPDITKHHSRRQIILIAVTVVILVLLVVGYLVAGAQATSASKKLAAWRQQTSTYAKAVSANTFADKMNVSGTETDAQLKVEQDNCNANDTFQRQISTLKVPPTVGFNPVGWLNGTYRKTRAASAADAKQTAGAFKQLAASEATYAKYCHPYVHDAALAQVSDKALADAKQYLLQTGTENATGNNCADIGGCVPLNNLAVWSTIAKDHQPQIADYTYIVDTIKKDGCFLPNYQKMCAVIIAYKTAQINGFTAYIKALNDKNNTELASASAALSSVDAEYGPKYKAAAQATTPGIDTNDPDYFGKQQQALAKKIDESLQQAAQTIQKA